MKKKGFVFIFVAVLFIFVAQGITEAAVNKIYWVDRFEGEILRVNPDSSNREPLITGLSSLSLIALDVSNNKMYWTDWRFGKTSKIFRSDLNGDNIEDLFTGSDAIEGIALDVSNNKMYWTEFDNKIRRANLDDFHVEDLFTQADGWIYPEELALDVSGDKMYWTNPVSGEIHRANLGGTGPVEPLLTSADGLKSPRSIALDVSNNKMYWTDTGTDKILRSDLNGDNMENLVTSADGLKSPRDIALDVSNNKMYWSDTGTGKILRSDLNGDNIEVVIKLDRVSRMALDLSGAGGDTPPTIKRPDLVVEPFRASKTSLAPGERFTLSATVRNRGTGQSVSTTLHYYFSSNSIFPRNDTHHIAETDSVSALGSNRTSDESIDLDAPTTPGTYYFKACVDSVPNEIDPNNNCSDAVKITIGASPAAQPDLALEGPWASKTTLSPGESFTLSVSVVNRGTADAPSTTLRYYRSINKAIATSETQFFHSVGGPKPPTGPNVFSETPLNLEAPDTPGTYYYSICIDPVENEITTDNNCITPIKITVQQTVTEKPDLVVESPRVSKSTLAPGESFTLSATVRNRGNGQASSTTLRYYRSSNDTISGSDTQVDTDTVNGLGANRTSDESVDLNAPTTPGTYYYGACVDNVANESDTANNCSTAVKITVETPAQRSDLVVERVWLIDYTLSPGQSFRLYARVSNVGTVKSPTTTLRYYRSNNSLISSRTDTQVDKDSVEGLMPLSKNGSASYQDTTLTAPTTPGTYHYGACVDPVNNESNSGNNCTAVSVTVEPVTVTTTIIRSPPLPIYWIDRGSDKIQRLNPNGTDVEDLVSEFNHYKDLTLDVTGGKMYWGTEPLYISEPPAKIQCVNLDGTNDVENLITGLSGLRSLALDVNENKIYWSASDKIQCANLDGTGGIEDIVTGLRGIYDIALDVNENKIYWIEAFAGKIQCVNLDDKNVKNIRTVSDYLSDFALDVSGGKMYWLDIGDLTPRGTTLSSGRIQRANLDGTNDVENLITGLSGLTSLALDVSGGKMYWTEPGGKIRCANLDGTGVEDIVTGLDKPDYIALGIPAGTPPPNRKPDLVVESPSVSKSTLAPGESFTLSVTVANRGTAEAGSTTLRYYRSSDPKISTSDTQVDTNTVNGLGLPTGGRSTSDESATLTAPTTPGTYYYGACVESVSNEGTTDNNCSTAVKITVEPPSDDHGDTLADATPLSVGIVRPGEVTFGLLSQGVIGTRNDIDYFCIEATGAGRLTVWTTGDLDTVGELQDSAGNKVASDDNTGTGRNFRIQHVVNSSTYYVKVQGHSGNTGSYTLHVGIVLDDPDSTADLIAQGTWVSDKTLDPGESFKLGVAVMNVGDALSPATTLKYYRSFNDEISTSDIEVGTDAVRRISDDGKSEEQITLTAPDTPGTYYYGACVESVKNEATTNNNCSPAVKVTVVPPDDYGDTRAEATLLPLNGSLNGVIETGADIDYFRVEVSEPGKLAVWTTGPLDTNGELQDGSGTVLASDDDSGSINNFNIELANPVTAGTYYIKVESYLINTGNYTIHASFVQQPDLVVESPSVSKDPLSPGESFTLSATVVNRGTGESSATTLRYYRLSDDLIPTLETLDTEVDTDTVDTLSRNSSSDESAELTAPTVPGTYYYVACVHSVKNEIDIDNNCSEVVSITVLPKTSAVVRVTPASITQGVGEPVTLKIDIADAPDIVGYNLTLEFDSAVLRYLGYRPASYYSDQAAPLANPNALQTLNKVTLEVTKLQRPEGGSGGTLALATFKVLQPKTSIVKLSNVKLTKKDGTVVYPGVEHGQITGTVLPPQQNIVRLIYFLPSDRVAQQNIDEKIDTLIHDAQQFFAEQMEQKNVHVRKTFTFETDAAGKAVVHQMNGALPYYEWHQVKSEVEAVFDTSRSLFFIAAELESICGLGGPHQSYDSGRWTSLTTKIGGIALIAASGSCFKDPTVTYHELGHAFGLLHDFRNDTYIMSYVRRLPQLSNCAAEWLDASRFFNSNQPLIDDEVARIEMLPLVANQQKTINFTITDADGLHQVQLIVAPNDEKPPPGYPFSEEEWRKLVNHNKQQYLHACKRLNGESDTVEFSIDGLNADEVMLQVIDKYGNFVRQDFSLPSYDHGDTAADATPLPLDSSLAGEIETSTDVDYFRIEVNGPGTLVVHTTGSLDTMGELQDSSGAILASNDDAAGNNTNFRIKHAVTAGTYYIKVRGYDVDTGTYTVQVSFSPDDVDADVNGDGVVDESDLMIVTANLGKANATHAQGDVNGDGEVNLSDVIAVLEVLEGAAAPTANSREMSTFTIERLQKWIDRAKQLNISDADFQRGIAVLEELLKTLIETEKVPAQTALLANYPNPFNPETWIPYQLAKPSDVTLRIYAANGTLVRTLALGTQAAGVYQSRARAASWDGKNELGEAVASGVYFYTLTAGDFTATRKMLIRK